MARSKVLAGTALVGVVALAGCSSSASDAPSASATSGSAASSGAPATPMNDAAGIAANAQYVNFQDSTYSVPVVAGSDIAAITQACNAKSNGVNPLVVINFTDQAATFNYSNNDSLATVINAVNPEQLSSGFTCTNSATAMAPATSQPVTVPGGQSMVTLLTTGSNGATNTLGSVNHNLSIGGGASGNTQWYDLYLHMNTSKNSFENWELGYENTGGLNPAQNTQPGLFNVVECSMASDGSVTTSAAVINGTLTQLPQVTIATPYGSNQNRWTYNSGDPICLGFFQEDFPAGYNPAS